jgi:hypothetical protein
MVWSGYLFLAPGHTAEQIANIGHLFHSSIRVYTSFDACGIWSATATEITAVTETLPQPC